MTLAVMQIWRDQAGSNDAPGSSLAVESGNLRFKAADNNVQDSNNPLTIPGAGNYHSRWKHIYLKCTTLNDLDYINNVKFYCDGTIGWDANVTLYVGTNTPEKNSGSSAGYEVANVDDEDMVTSHAHVSGQADIETYYDGDNALAVSISEGSSQIDALNETSDYVVLQVDVAAGASPGAQSAETLTFQYDEVDT